jgi:hypothetical protein
MAAAGSTAPYRLIALDIDGTVVDASQRVAGELRGLLALLAARGVRTVLCTGRRWRTAVPVAEELEHVHPIVICCGGALIKRADDERTLHREPLDHETARLATGLFARGGLVPMLLYDRNLDGRELLLPASAQSRAEELPYVAANAEACGWFEGDYPGGDEPPLVVYSMDAEPKVRAARRTVADGLAGRAVLETMRQARYGDDQVALEAHALTATKWRGLCWLLERWGLGPEHVIAIGDDVNDIPMLEAAGLSFAMGDASEEVKAAADAVTERSDRQGVARALRIVFGTLD